MADSGPSGPRRDLWALPSEELPPGAAAFLQMARDLAAGIEAGLVFPPELSEELPPEAAGPAAEVIHLFGAPLPEAGADDALSSGRGSGRPADVSQLGPRLAGAGEGEPADDENARLFLEMVDRAETVRVFPAQDGDVHTDWIWATAEEGSSAADMLLSTIEQAMHNVSQSEYINNEELRARLLDLFTDFAVRHPWRDEERPGAQRMNRVAARGDGEGLGEPSR